MELRKYQLGQLTEQCVDKNEDNLYGSDSVIRISVNKELAPTKANLKDVSLKNFILVEPKSFVYAADTSRRGDKISLAYNSSSETYLASNFHIVFRLNDFGRKQLLEEYLFMYFNRSEFDRYARMHSWGSARERFYYSDMSDVEIELPPIEVQRKYVDIYEVMLANQRAYEQGLDDLKLACDALVERLMRELPHEAIGAYIEQSDARNSARAYSEKDVRGLSVSKCIVETNANLTGVNLGNYKIIRPDELAYVADTSRRGEKISIALNETDDTYITSAINTVFRVKKSAEQRLLPGYLMLFFGRAEFDRYARFNSWGSARETFDWAEMCDVHIPLPDIVVQRYIVELYQAWRTRLGINDRLKAQLKDICPVLIRGSIEEASR